MNAWRWYFFFALAYEVGVTIYVSAQGLGGFWVTTFLQAIFFVGLFGFAFGRRIASRQAWRYIFAVGVVVLVHAWVIMPLVYIDADMSLRQILIIQAFQLPLVPMFVALYCYAWRSTGLWYGDA